MNDDRNIDLTAPTDLYNIAHFPYGIAIRGECPIEIAGRLMIIFSDLYGYTICDALLSEHLQAQFVVTSREKGDLWRKALNLSVD